jgi:flagellar hook-length control protein FliK
VSAAATVVVSSAEGAGDMPSSVPVGSGDVSQDGAQPFSEVLSLSSPDHPGPSDSAAPPEPSQSPGDAHDESGTAASVPQAPTARTPGALRERAQRRAGTSERGDGHVRRAVGSPPLPAVGKADQIPLPGPTQTQAEGVAADVDQTLGATHPLATSATPVAPVPTSTVEASTASGGSAVSPARTELPGGDDVLAAVAPAQDGSGPETVASLAAQLPHALGAGSTSDGAGRNPAPTDVTGKGDGEARGVADRGAAPGSAALGSGPVRIQVNGSTPGAAASALSAPATGTSGTAVVSADGVLEPAEFPDAGGGTTGVAISDLAASISRPLAEGNGDYSVQVSLHPPELGEVRALLSLQGDVLHVTLTPEHPSGFDALSDAMPALHEQLAGGGVEVHVTLGQPGDPEGGDGRAAAEAGPAGKAPSDDATPPVVSVSATPVSTGGPGRIHLVL